MIAEAKETLAVEAAAARGASLLGAADFQAVVQGYAGFMDLGPGIEPRLKAALQHVLAHPGSLLRAQLGYSIMKDRGTDPDRALATAIALEYFHTASLVFDDMPAMDNAMERRGTPCVHVAFDEATATLAGLALINRGYALLWQSIGALPERERMEAARLVTECLGLQGILNGQSRDLRFAASARCEKDVMDVAMGKTVTLIRLTLLLPALVSGIPASQLPELDQLATLWGLSYQIMDDFKDCLMTETETGKTVSRDSLLQHPNLPQSIGHETAWSRLQSFMDGARNLVDSLIARDPDLQVLRRLQQVLEDEKARIHELLRASCPA